MRPEHMFNGLNNLVREGKNSPMVCKFLLSVSAFPRTFTLGLERALEITVCRLLAFELPPCHSGRALFKFAQERPEETSWQPRPPNRIPPSLHGPSRTASFRSIPPRRSSTRRVTCRKAFLNFWRRCTPRSPCGSVL